MKNKILVILVAVLLLATMLLAGCKTTTPEESSAPAETEAAATEEAMTEEPMEMGDPTEIVMTCLSFGPTPTDMQEVNDAINELLLEKLNVLVDIQVINAGNYTTQVNLTLTSNEKMDLYVTGNLGALMTYSLDAPQGKLYPLDDLLDEYGQGIVESLGSTYLDAARVSGTVYGVPTLRDMGQATSYYMRKDLADEYGIDPTQIKTLDDLSDVFATVKEANPEMYPIAFGTTFPASETMNVDTKFDSLNDYIGVLLDNEVLEISNYYASDLYKELTALTRSWYLADYMDPEALSGGTVNVEDRVKAGAVFSLIAASKPGGLQQQEARTGYELYDVVLKPGATSTGGVTIFMWGIPSYTPEEDAIAAMKVLNAMYTDSEFVNMLDWGLEGKHYEKVEGSDILIKYPEGVDSGNSGYNFNMNFMFGNQFLSYIWETDSPDLWTEMQEFNDNLIASKALGFAFDTSVVKTEYAAVNNVIAQYSLSIGSGQVDPEVEIPNFIAALEAAGINTIIEAKQEALDEWAAINGIS